MGEVVRLRPPSSMPPRIDEGTPRGDVASAIVEIDHQIAALSSRYDVLKRRRAAMIKEWRKTSTRPKPDIGVTRDVRS